MEVKRLAVHISTWIIVCVTAIRITCRHPQNVLLAPECSKGKKTKSKETKKFVPQFYRKPLPTMDGAVVAFGSNAGRVMFQDALSSGYMESFFPLIEQFRTQDEPAFCGISTLAMILNACQVDPGRLWKGPWRWYSEKLLDCCKPLREVETEGLTIAEFTCLAKCNGLIPTQILASESSEEDFRKHVKACSSESKEENRPFLVVSYTRKGLGQSGDGHFSPIGGYCPNTDSCLILDVARFKYPPHFVKLSTLYKAMLPLDKTSGKSRGFVVVKKAPTQGQLLFRFKGREHEISTLAAKLQNRIHKLLDEEIAHSKQDVKSTMVNIVERCLSAIDSKQGPVVKNYCHAFAHNFRKCETTVVDYPGK
mmetsp:Transcript_32062/g.59690  ORF Transcript_32062/g.59690 Transcript_32062/m.59690 type:complete len:365 (-) Transcript_32062:607-1701(-)